MNVGNPDIYPNACLQKKLLCLKDCTKETRPRLNTNFYSGDRGKRKEVN